MTSQVPCSGACDRAVPVVPRGHSRPSLPRFFYLVGKSPTLLEASKQNKCPAAYILITGFKKYIIRGLGAARAGNGPDPPPPLPPHPLGPSTPLHIVISLCRVNTLNFTNLENHILTVGFFLSDALGRLYKLRLLPSFLLSAFVARTVVAELIWLEF